MVHSAVAGVSMASMDVHQIVVISTVDFWQLWIFGILLNKTGVE